MYSPNINHRLLFKEFTDRSSLNAVTIATLKRIASAQLAKSFWNWHLKTEELTGISEDVERQWEIPLVNHREKTISASSDFIEKYKLPSCFKTFLEESIFSLYQAHRQLFLWKVTYDSDNKIDLAKEGELYAPNYFNVDGEFNDLAWMKRFVFNSHHSIASRFYLACSYRMEYESAKLWAELKESYPTPFGGNLVDISDRKEKLISLRLFQLEHYLKEDRRYSVTVWPFELEKAAKQAYEHATYYFWQKLAEPKKVSITENDRFFELMSGAIDYPHDKISYFLYSKLSQERKEDLLDWTIQRNRPYIWLTLLLSPYSQGVRSEIIEFVYQLPIDMYSTILEALALRIRQLKLPFDIETFHVLWSDLCLCQKHVALNEGMSIIEHLVEAKSFYNLRHIIKGFSIKQKEMCLFDDWYGAGINSLDILSSEGEYDLLQKYLSLFLFEIDPLAHKETLRKGASLLLRKFVQTSDFKKWSEEIISKSEEMEISARIDNLQLSIALLDDICEKVSNETNGERYCKSPSFKSQHTPIGQTESTSPSSSQNL